MEFSELQELLDHKVDLYNRLDFIESDPISIPHQFSKNEDIEISGFFAATLAWGQRKTIIRNANDLMDKMDRSPYDFILNHSAQERKQFSRFVHRTFNGVDCIYFLKSLQHLYKNHQGLYGTFKKSKNIEDSISRFKQLFFELPHPSRTQKHIADPLKNSSAKRLCMYLRWMVRNDKRKVDFGIWKQIPASQLYCPLDVHSARVARELGLLTRKQNDWKAVVELTEKLKQFDKLDPVKYDFALFGMGVFENES